MISFGAVIVDSKLNKTFYGKLKPISKKWVPEALAVSGFNREQTLDFDEPKLVMEKFRVWLSKESNGWRYVSKLQALEKNKTYP
jgi:hypothetical protein